MINRKLAHFTSYEHKNSALIFSCVNIPEMLLLVVFSLIASSESKFCYSDSSCSWGESCCKSVCKVGLYDCRVGSSCDIDSNCSSGESCCNNACTYGYHCFGLPCSKDSDCKSWDICCDGSCADQCFPNVMIGSIISGFILISLFALCVCFVCGRCKSIPRHGRVTNERLGTPTEAQSFVAQGNPLYPQPALPSYQQGYPYYPPLQYARQYPPLYTAGVSTAADKPPPYTAAVRENSQGVYSPQDSYGTMAP